MDTIKTLLWLLLIISLSANKVNAQDDDITNPIIIPDITGINPLYSFDAEDPIHPFFTVNYTSARNSILNFGDINGDGWSDFGILFRDSWDERQSQVSLTNKTIIYYGNSSVKEGNLRYYDWLYPIGDIDNDGFADAVMTSNTNTGYTYDHINTILKDSNNGFVETDRIITGKTSNETYFNLSQTDTFIDSIDLNNDGLNDTIVLKANVITILWGNSEITEMTWTSQWLNDIYIDNYKGIGLYDLNKDSIPEIVFSNRYSRVDSLNILTYNKETTSFEIYQHSPIAVELYDSFDVADFNGDKIPEIGFFSRTAGNRFYSFDTTSRFFDFENPDLLTTYYYLPIGDINGDEIADLAFFNNIDSVYAIGLGKTGELNDYSADILLNRIQLNSILSKTNRFNSISEIGNHLVSVNRNYNSSEPYTKSFEEDDLFFLEVQRVDSTTQQLVKSTDIHLTQQEIHNLDRILAIQNLGDLNNDSIEDFGIVYSDRGELQVHYGGKISELPDVIYNLKSSEEDKNRYLIYSGVTSADFNGDGYLDLILSSQTHSFIKIFLGSPSGPDTEVDMQLNYFEQIGYIYWIENLGDINADGFEDILVSTRNFKSTNGKYPETGFLKIIYGASTESEIEAHDVRIYSDKVISYFNYYNVIAKKMDDYNGDGLPDFAISATEFSDFSDGQSSGAVFIYYGKKEKSSYDTFDEMLYYPKRTSRFGNFLTANKDFNGDGTPDLGVGVGFTFGSTNRTANIYLNKSSTPDSVFIQYSSIIPDPTNTGFISFFVGSLHFIDDVNNDSMDELVFTTGMGYYSSGGYTSSNAGIIFGDNSTTKYHLPEIVFKSPNPLTGLGGAYRIAVGDFDGDEETIEFIFPQEEGSLKGYRTGNWHVYQLNKSMLSSVDEEFEVKKVELFQNYPNPFNPTTQIKYNLPKSSSVSINIYNSLGQLIAKPLSKSQRNAGVHTLDFNGSKLASGVYFYELLTDENKMVKSMILIK